MDGEADHKYVTGYLTAVGWQLYSASVFFLVGTIIQGLIALNSDDYSYARWHGTLLAIAVIVFSISFNTVFASKMPFLRTFPIESTFIISTFESQLTPHQKR